MKKTIFDAPAIHHLLLLITLFLAACSSVPITVEHQSAQLQIQQPSLKRLSDQDIATVKVMLGRLEPFIQARKKAGNQALLTFNELYQQLDPAETRLARFVTGLTPEQIGVLTPWIGYGDPATPMVALNESYKGPNGVTIGIPTQYLPAIVHDRYRAMMSAMQKDLGKRLYVSSGYRSGAYQLYLLFLYLPHHDWSLQKTGKVIALPGYSEHGATHRQAVDFVSEGASMDDESEEFEKQAEYKWLQTHAGTYRFFLSYPRSSATGISFEPWHWHFEP
jgi:hypothetical protein